MRRLLAAFLLLPFSAPAAAKVNSAGPGGFEVQSTAIVSASPADVWTMLGRPSEWWNAEHSWSGKAENLRLDLKAGGCFCEAVPPGGSAEHGRVLRAVPGRTLVLDAPLGPLQTLGVSARLTWELRSAPGGGTEIVQTYAVGGYMPMGGEKLAPLVDGVLGKQLERLRKRLGGKG